METNNKAVLDLIAYTDKYLSNQVQDTFKVWKEFGSIGTQPNYYRFTYLFETARRGYIHEIGPKHGAGQIINISVNGMKEYCQHYVNVYYQQKSQLV